MNNRGYLKMAMRACMLVCCFSVAGTPPLIAAQQAGVPDESWLIQDRYAAKLNGDEFEIDIWRIEGEDVIFIDVEGNLLKRLGVEVYREELEDGQAKATLEKNGRKLEFVQGQEFFTFDDEPEELYMPPLVTQNLLLIPSKEMFEEMGFSVIWDHENKTIRIEEGKLPGVYRVIPERLPPGYLDSVFKYPAGEPATGSAAADEGRPMEEIDYDRLFQYTYDNTIAFSNIAISGDVEGSNYIPTTAFTDNFNVSFQQRLRNDYMMKGVVRTTETNDPQFNQGQMDKLAISFEKESSSIKLYDMMPKYNYYTLRNYQVQGFDITRNLDAFSISVLGGKSPKRLYDSEYSRHINGFRLYRSKKRGRSIAFSSVFTKDTGGTRLTDQYSNRVYSFDYRDKMGKTTKMSLDYALSTNRMNGAANATGNALLAKVDYKKAKSSVKLKFERVGSDFNSETTFFTAGKREASLLYARKQSNRLVYSTGYKTVLLDAEETLTVPVYVSMSPLVRRPKFKLVMTKNYEKARSSTGTRVIDTKKVDFKDIWWKNVNVSGTYERKKQKEIDGFVGFRIVRKSKLEMPLTEKLILDLQAKDEHRTWGSRPLTRFVKAGLTYELGDWSSIYGNLSRYYNATSNDRAGLAIGFAEMDIINNKEINIEYRYLNYRDHNDNVFKVSYSIFR